MAVTRGQEYADRLAGLNDAQRTQVLSVQAACRSHIRRLHRGRTLDVGCGVGSTLVTSTTPSASSTKPRRSTTRATGRRVASCPSARSRSRSRSRWSGGTVLPHHESVVVVAARTPGA